MGVDVTYPLHRYFSWVTDIAHALGGPLPGDGAGSRTRPPRTSSSPSEQRALKAELRDYFTGLAGHDEHRDR